MCVGLRHCLVSISVSDFKTAFCPTCSRFKLGSGDHIYWECFSFWGLWSLNETMNPLKDKFNTPKSLLVFFFSFWWELEEKIDAAAMSVQMISRSLAPSNGNKNPPTRTSKTCRFFLIHVKKTKFKNVATTSWLGADARWYAVVHIQTTCPAIAEVLYRWPTVPFFIIVL